MEKKFAAKGKDIEAITHKIANFLTEKGFETSVEKSRENLYEIFAANSPYYKIERVVQVTIKGEKEYLTANVELLGEKTPIRNIWLMHMIGAGALLVNEWRTRDTWMQLEKEIWNYMQTIMEQPH